MKLLSIKTVCLATVAAFLFSCNKEVLVEPNINGPVPVNPGGNPDPGNGNGNGNGNSNSIQGTYKVVFMSQDGVSTTVSGVGADRTQVKYTYTTTYEKFTGTYNFDSKNINLKGFGYTFNMQGIMRITGGGFDDSMPYGGPATMTFPDNSSPYQLKGTDSIITKTMMGGGSINGTPTSSNPSGLQDTQTLYYTFSGDTLIMKMRAVISNREMVQDGQLVVGNGYTNALMKMVRVK
ncbi:hypothetical protein CLV59_104431 [Chitinophaga dinghuensis]|uniref:Lipocalin-like protein n=1 Tax=Chitinophaga dinghuensis TaxID=1539050 RepID=A0A327W1Q4_9BACT|nr:hypothetical protein [Chitinophaga dinghuensis]RAJ82206.1 hypothetical protein CLV59_104431 [Chitinophaga dinghuensis]